MSIQFSTYENELSYDIPSQPKRLDEALGLAWQADKSREEEDIENAMVLYKQALEKDPFNVWCMENLSQIYLDRGDFSSAENLWRQAGDKLTSRRWFYLAKMAELFEERRKSRQAESLLKEAESLLEDFLVFPQYIREIVANFYEQQKEKWFPPLRKMLLRGRLKQERKVALPITAAASVPLKQKDGKETKFRIEVISPSITDDGQLSMFVQIPEEDMKSLKNSRIELARGNVVLCTEVIGDVNQFDLGKDATIPVHLLDDEERKQLEEAESVELDPNDFTFYLIRQSDR